MCIANCPFNKIKILCAAMKGLEKSFRMMYSNLCLNSRETVPLKGHFHKFVEIDIFLSIEQQFMVPVQVPLGDLEFGTI